MHTRKVLYHAPFVTLLGTALLVGTLLVSTSGCEDSCSASAATTRCAGLDLQSCSLGSQTWSDLGLCGAACTSETCPGGPVSKCITNGEGTSFCATSPDPIPECENGPPTTCWLNNIVRCDSSGYVNGVLEPCGGLTCANSSFDGGAFCAASARPIPECSGATATVCWQNQVTTCDPTGFARAVAQACGNLSCVDTPGCGPLCVLDPGPNPLCTPSTMSVCVDGTPTDCQCGYSVAAHPSCGSADLCQTAPLPPGSDAGVGVAFGVASTAAFCTLSPTPTPGCPPEGTYTICVGSALVECNAGWATSETLCSGECHAYGGVGSCG